MIKLLDDITDLHPDESLLQFRYLKTEQNRKKRRKKKAK